MHEYNIIVIMQIVLASSPGLHIILIFSLNIESIDRPGNKAIT